MGIWFWYVALIVYCRVNFDLFTFSADGVYCVEMESGEEVHKVQELDEVENNNLEGDIGKFQNIETEREDRNPSSCKTKSITKQIKNQNIKKQK